MSAEDGNGISRPGRSMPFDSAYDFGYRPATYWPDSPTEGTVLAQIKGTTRRDVARSVLAEPDPSIPEGAADFVLNAGLDEDQREHWGAIHPSHLGGEFVPDYDADEVEIARIDLASVTADAYQVRARRDRDSRIHYRVVDDYWDEGSRFDVRPATSDEPLTMGELIDLIDTTSRADEGHRYSDDVYNVGLFDMDREFSYREAGADEDELVDFVVVSSPFYPTLGAYYDARASHWLAEIKAEYEDDDDE